ncbi:tRNA-intron lyase [Candidatus Bathyarchaeota archaeon]|nr:MAG: tRNA-intron lyase [Candidatus Bathyarchaeota archaeon]
MAAKALLSGGKVMVHDEGYSAELAKKGYGSRGEGGLILEPWEALYLVEKGKIEVLREPKGRPLDFQELLREFKARDEWIWAKFLIYRDLRERGYVVKKGFGPGMVFRLYERGGYGRKPARFLVYGILEGSPIRVSDIQEALLEARASDKELLLAVVERRGEVIYYQLQEWVKPRGPELGPTP